MTVTILQGDCRERLREMAAGSVHCVVTSPPYWGLRDYGLPPSVWGGDGECEHEWGDGLSSKTDHVDKRRWNHTVNGRGEVQPEEKQVGDAQLISQGQFCRLCNAWRGSLGLEPTPALFVSHLVEVMRDVRRVLRDDGTVFLNLGSSYASRDMNANQSPHALREPAYDTGDKERPDLLETDRACPRCGDVHQGDCLSHPRHISRNAQLPHANGDGLLTIARGKEHSDCGLASLDASVPDVLASSTLSSTGCDQDACDPEAKALACPSQPHSSSGDVLGFGHRSVCTCDTAETQPSSDHHTSDKESSFLAQNTSYQEPIALTLLYSTIKSLNVKQKDLLMIPEFVALALQADGWYLRSAIIWAKGISFCPTYSGSVMPESVRDRPTSAYEHVFLLTKRGRYYYDGDAVRENLRYPDRTYAPADNHKTRQLMEQGNRTTGGLHDGRETYANPAGRNLRNVWAINPAGFPGVHFATFPPALIRPMILAGTSERGCCGECGAPWERVVSRENLTRTLNKGQSGFRPDQIKMTPDKGASSGGHPVSTTLGWRPSCTCYPATPWAFGDKPIQADELDIALPLLAEYAELDTVPCVTLDPFGGAGTTAIESRRQGRDSIYMDLSPEYCEMARRRLEGTEEIETVDHNGDTVAMEQATLFSGVRVE